MVKYSHLIQVCEASSFLQIFKDILTLDEKKYFVYLVHIKMRSFHISPSKLVFYFSLFNNNKKEYN